MSILHGLEPQATSDWLDTREVWLRTVDDVDAVADAFAVPSVVIAQTAVCVVIAEDVCVKFCAELADAEGHGVVFHTDGPEVGA